MPNVQMHFELEDWEEAFEAFHENRNIGMDVVMIVSTHPYTEGYWVESTPDPLQVRPTDKVYVGQEVDALEVKVREGHKNGRPDRFIF